MQRLVEFEERHDGEVEQLKVSMDFRRADFSCQWKRNVEIMVAHIASVGGVRGEAMQIMKPLVFGFLVFMISVGVARAGE